MPPRFGSTDRLPPRRFPLLERRAWLRLLLLGVWASGLFAIGRAADGSLSVTNTFELVTMSPAQPGRAITIKRGPKDPEPATLHSVLDTDDQLITRKAKATVKVGGQFLELGHDTSFRVLRNHPTPVIRVLGGSLWFSSATGSTKLQISQADGSRILPKGTEYALHVGTNTALTLTMIDGEAGIEHETGGQLHTNQLGSMDAGVLSDGRWTAEKLAGAGDTQAARLEINRRIQWALYYPGILNLDELPESLDAGADAALSDSLLAYRRGSILQAFQAYATDASPRADTDDLEPPPPGSPGKRFFRPPANDSERLYQAALCLSVGGVQGAQDLLSKFDPGDSPHAEAECAGRLARALRVLIAAVLGEPAPGRPEPKTSTEWLAESFYQQSRIFLPKDTNPPPWEARVYKPRYDFLRRALEAARYATNRAGATLCAQRTTNPRMFTFAAVRLAEMHFSYGDADAALPIVVGALADAPDNAQAHALHGFLLTAKHEIKDATASFQRAIELDPGLGNGWLGRGLCQIRLGEVALGVADLQQAVASEPNRAFNRSYLAKAYEEAADTLGRFWSSKGARVRENIPAPADGSMTRLLEGKAARELIIARRLDPDDPTSALYSALMNRSQNRINEAVSNLEESVRLNDNRALYRSAFLLDQDRAVRSANLAGLYRDAGMEELSLREASRAVQGDFANYSAHLFLANSYDNLRDPRGITLRYETPWANELLLANLLAPVGAGSLSQRVSQQEYSSLFEHNHLGLFSYTEYRSSGDWLEQASQYGTVGSTSYSLDAYYLSQTGTRPNEDQENRTTSIKLKQEFTPADSALVQVVWSDVESGDLTSYYNPADASTTQRIRERQEPIVLAGYHHEWSPRSHTLFLAARLSDLLNLTNSAVDSTVLVKDANGDVLPRFFPTPLKYDLGYRSELEIYSLEAQQMWQSESGKWGAILGGRYQFGDFETANLLNHPSGYPFFPPLIFTSPLASTNVTTDFRRGSGYLYVNWEPVSHLLLTGGVAYDTIEYPVNHRVPPVSGDDGSQDQVSPKAGVIWSPFANTTVRGSYTRSLGGVSFDQSVRLEPSQVAGFIQSYRSLIPESLVGSVVVPTSDLGGVELEQRFPTRTYVAVRGEWLQSESAQEAGLFEAIAPRFGPIRPDQTPLDLKFRERNVIATVNQLLGDEWALAISYRLSYADLEQSFGALPLTVGFNPSFQEARSQQLNLGLLYNLPCGFFAQAQGVWCQQDNLEPTPALPGDDFWQFNLFAGYRFFRRRAEVRIGVLNVTDQDYRLNPINLFSDLPRERLFFASLKLSF